MMLEIGCLVGLDDNIIFRIENVEVHTANSLASFNAESESTVVSFVEDSYEGFDLQYWIAKNLMN